MKRYMKELIILIMQLVMFYVFPIFAGPTDAMGMVILMFLATLILSIIIGIISKEKIKFLYSIVISILFIPTVFIYYNESAMIHSVWYFVVSSIGLIFGTFVNELLNKK